MNDLKDYIPHNRNPEVRFTRVGLFEVWLWLPHVVGYAEGVFCRGRGRHRCAVCRVVVWYQGELHVYVVVASVDRVRD